MLKNYIKLFEKQISKSSFIKPAQSPIKNEVTHGPRLTRTRTHTDTNRHAYTHTHTHTHTRTHIISVISQRLMPTLFARMAQSQINKKTRT